MARRTVDVEVNTFVRGLITEASPLTFPENASLSETNFVLNRDGSRQRRLGLEYEDEGVLTDTTRDFEASPELAINTYVWKNAAKDGSLDILVVQVGRELHFFDNNKDIITSNKLLTNGWDDYFEFTATTPGASHPEDVITFGSTITGPEILPYRFASVQGDLIVIDLASHAHTITYDKNNDKAEKRAYHILTRDIWGIDLPDIDVDHRPTSEEFTIDERNRKRYNLLNRSWFTPTALDSDAFSTRRAYSSVLTVLGFYPSESDIIWAAKGSNGRLQEDIFLAQINGTTPGPRGGVIVDAFSRGQYRRDALEAENSEFSNFSGANFPDDKTNGYVNAVASYAGRVFYGIKEESITDGDAKSPRIGSFIFFSQVATSRTDLSKCYSEADPTAEDTAGVVDSDGGFISIPDMGELISLVPLENSLFVLASNGVWEIHGGDSPFSANNQTVDKVTSIGALSSGSVIVAESVLAYWAESGIYLISKDEVSLRGKATNITVSTIQSLYEEITVGARLNTTSVYDPVSRQVRWQYGSGLTNNKFKDKELILDLDLQAFYTSDIGVASSSGPYIVDSSSLPGTIFNEITDNVVVQGDNVVAGSDNVVSTGRKVDETTKGSTKYLTVVKNDSDGKWYFTMSHYREATFHDWKIHDGVGIDAKGTLLTGFLTAGVASKDKKVPYIVTHFRLTEEGFSDDGLGNLTPLDESSCFLQAQWNWTNSEEAGRWSSKFQAYKLPRYWGSEGSSDPFDYGHTVVTTKSKIRGRGGALSLLFETEENMNMHLYGWGHTLNIENKS